MVLIWRITLLCIMVSMLSCVPKDQLDEALADKEELARKYERTKDRADTLEWYVNRILPVLTLRQRPEVRAQVLPDIVMLNERYPYDRNWGDTEAVQPAEQEVAAAVAGRLVYLTQEGLRPVSSSDIEGIDDFSTVTVSLQDGNAIPFTPMKGTDKYSLTIDQDFLFGRGEFELKSQANQTLSNLAYQLKNLQGYWITVEGHTDNLEFYEGKEKMSSWELSVMRAARVVERLDDYGVSPENMIASGKGQFENTFVNTREENRKLNRRIEIILTPKDRN